MCRCAYLAITLLGGMMAIAATAGAQNVDPGPKDSWVRFTSFSYEGTDPAADRLSSPAKQYLNPILAGFYPDPSLCRAGDQYYLVNSSFSYWPGVPIFRSTNLVDWTQIGYVLDRVSDFNTLRDGEVSRGIYAPTLRYHDGTFYLITTLVNGDGNFYVTAHDPAGPWSDPHWLHSVDGIDPSFFFDDDGKAYVVHCAPAPDNHPLYNGHRTLRIREFDLKSGELIGPEKILVNGGTDLSKQPHWIEGPHLFKRNGTYYLIAAEGGTGYDHSEVVFCSDSVWGPYTSFPGNPILTQRQLPPDRPDAVTSTGHADLVQTASGQWWAVFLGCRPFERNFYNTGRETFLLPMNWKDGRPIILPGNQPVPRIAVRPDLPATQPAQPTTGSFRWTDKFDSDHLNLRWNFLRAPTQEWFSVNKPTGTLLLAPRPVSLSSYDNPSALFCRLQHAKFTASTTIAIAPNARSCEAGLVAFQNEAHYFFLGVRIDSGVGREVFLEQASTPPTILAIAPLPADCKQIELKVEANGRPYSFSYRANDEKFIPLKQNVDGSFLSTDVAGGFQGVMLGLYARTFP